VKSLFAQAWIILRNDLRLLWRNFRAGRWAALGKTALLGVIVVVLHGFAITFFWTANIFPPLFVDSLIWALFGFMMLGAAMNQAIALLFERADFDLLLSSPIDPRAVLLARIAAITSAAFLSVALFLAPILNGAIVALSRSYLAGYVVWILLAASSAAAGVSLTLILVRWIGARRTRTWIQIVAGVMGALVYLAFQSRNYLPREQEREYERILMGVLKTPLFSAVSRAGRGELLELGLLFLLTVCLVYFATRQLARTFVGGVQETGGQPAQKRPTGHYLFSGKLSYVTFRKDVRLILREPLLLSQILPSMMYVVPAFLGFRRNGGILMLAPISVVVATQFSTLLTSVAASGEEGLDLIRMSPSPELQLRYAKMAAGMAVPLTISLMLCTIVAFAGHPWLGLIAIVTGLATAAAGSWLQVASIRPSPRKDILKRRRGDAKSLVVGFLLLSGAAGVGLIAYGATLLFGILALGVTALTVCACFTLVGLKELPSDSS